MALVGGGDIQIHQDNDNHDDGNVTAGNVGNIGNATDQDGDATGTAAATGPAGGTGTTNFNLRVEQNKIPKFFGTKSKDTISAADFIRQLEDLATTNQWMEAQTYYHFANALCNRLVNGSPHWWTGTMTSVTSQYGQISKMFSSRNMQSRRTSGSF